MYTKHKKIFSKDPTVNEITKLYVESLTEQELSESTSDEDLLNTAFSTLLCFLVGDGNKVLKDDEWMNYVKNDINAAIQKRMFKPSFEDKQNLKKLQNVDEDSEEGK